MVTGWAISKVPGVGDLGKDLYHNLNDWRRYRAQQTVNDVAQRVGPDELVQDCQDNPELAALLVQALEAAEQLGHPLPGASPSRTGFDAKRRLLALAVANAFQNDERIDNAGLVVRALSELDTVHIRALTRLTYLSDSLGPDPNQEHPDRMKQASEDLPLPVVVALINAGVVIESPQPGKVLHDVSDFGRQLIRELRLADPDDKFLNWVPPN